VVSLLGYLLGALTGAAVVILAVTAVLAWQRRPGARAAAEDPHPRPASPCPRS
jgi:uncharacterized iron-regulated membrane protein